MLTSEKDAIFHEEVTILELLGDFLHCYTKINDSNLIMKASALTRIRKGDVIHFAPNYDFACFFDAETEERIR